MKSHLQFQSELDWLWVTHFSLLSVMSTFVLTVPLVVLALDNDSNNRDDLFLFLTEMVQCSTACCTRKK